MKDLKVYYQTDYAGGLDSLFEKEIGRLAKRWNLKFQGSGLEFKTGVRDIHYRKEGGKNEHRT